MQAVSTALSAPDYWLTRLLIQRGLGVVYLIAFLNAVNQFPALLGERGLIPSARHLGPSRFREAPSLLQLHYSDAVLRGLGGIGIAGSVAIVLGLPEMSAAPVSMAVWGLLWALYVSMVNAGETFYAFGWESLLCEAGFLAVFLGPASVARRR